MTQPEFLYYHWGPALCKFTIEEDFRLGLLDRSKKLRNDFRNELYGHIDKEYEFTDREYFAKGFEKIFDEYKKHTEWWFNKKKFSKAGIISLWVNFMQKGEFNPLHYHKGDFSFVIYLDVPEEIYSSNIISTDEGGGPGTIYFHYGEISNKHAITTQKFQPKTGEMFIFPATLGHSVAPFRFDVTRISMSGNLEITE